MENVTEVRQAGRWSDTSASTGYSVLGDSGWLGDHGMWDRRGTTTSYNGGITWEEVGGRSEGSL
jgi:hypothetical protein